MDCGCRVELPTIRDYNCTECSGADVVRHRRGDALYQPHFEFQTIGKAFSTASIRFCKKHRNADALMAILAKAVNRLHSQGAGISEITDRINMIVSNEAMSVLDRAGWKGKVY